MVYQVANVTIHDSDGDCFIKFCTAANNHSTRRAWNIGFDNWKKQRAIALTGITGQQTGKWSDFKVFLSNNHRGNTDSQHSYEDIGGIQVQQMSGGLMPSDVENNEMVLGEWIYSQFYEHEEYDTAGAVDQSDIVLIGNHKKDGTDMQAVSLVQAYQEILNIPTTSPAAVGLLENSWYSRMFNAGNDEIVQDIDDENDMPPYSAAYLIGGMSNMPSPQQKRVAHIASSYSPMAQVGGFSVPCGLLCIETKNFDAAENKVGITIEMVPGDYRGFAAQPM